MRTHFSVCTSTYMYMYSCRKMDFNDSFPLQSIMKCFEKVYEGHPLHVGSYPACSIEPKCRLCWYYLFGMHFKIHSGFTLIDWMGFSNVLYQHQVYFTLQNTCTYHIPSAFVQIRLTLLNATGM